MQCILGYRVVMQRVKNVRKTFNRVIVRAFREKTGMRMDEDGMKELNAHEVMDCGESVYTCSRPD